MLNEDEGGWLGKRTDSICQSSGVGAIRVQAEHGDGNTGSDRAGETERTDTWQS